MLKLESQDVVGQTAYWEDDADPFQYYALPGEPTLAIRDGRPVFKYVKYRSPVDRPGGVKAGAMVVMQAELALPAKDEQEIRNRIAERLRARGFNQSALLASVVAEGLGVPLYPGVLRRTRDTAVQAGLTRERRVANVSGAFAAAPIGRRVLLIDDVHTTGATLAAAASALERAGSPEVTALALAAAPG